MNFTTQHQQIALTLLGGIGSRRARILVSHFNDLDAFFTEKKLNLSKIPGVPANFVSFKQRIEALVAADKIMESLQKIDASTVFFTEPNYPKRLKRCEDAPLLLYKKGNIDLNPERSVSIVGTRNATEYGKKLTTELIEGLRSQGVTIVSGMAYGIDICAHQLAVKYGLPTWGVLGHGVDLMYPSVHRKIADKMLEQGGLISEFYPGVQPEPPHFPMRNRIVAGLADATIVVESGDKGGSLITASLADSYNRDVFAYPGDIGKPYSKGCLQLILQNKANLCTRAQDILDHMNWKKESNKLPTQQTLFLELNQQEEKIISALKTKTELTLDSICYLSSLSVSETSSELLSLEFKGVIKSLPGKRFSLA